MLLESRMAAIRHEFPVADDLLYFDAAAIAPVPRGVQRSVLDEQLQTLSLGTAAPADSRLEQKRRAARIAAGRLLSVHPDHVAIASSAMAGVRDSLSQLDVAPGNVVVFGADYPDLVRCCRRFCAVRQLELRAVPSPCVDAVGDLAALEEACDPDTRLIAVCNVHSSTGRELSIGDLARLASSKDALLLVDASQSVGVLPIDARVVDLLVAAGYKWMCGQLGAAVATASDRLLDACAAQGRPTTVAEFLEPSTMSPYATAILNGSIEYLLDIGIPRIVEHNRLLTGRLRAGLVGLQATLATSESSRAPHMLSARFDGCDTASLVRDLAMEGVIVSEREGWARWAPHLYTSTDDVDRALEVLTTVLSTAAAP